MSGETTSRIRTILNSYGTIFEKEETKELLKEIHKLAADLRTAQRIVDSWQSIFRKPPKDADLEFGKQIHEEYSARKERLTKELNQKRRQLMKLLKIQI